MPKKTTRLEYANFERIRKGQAGYNKHGSYVDKSTGEIITRATFRTHAQPVTTHTPISSYHGRIASSNRLANYYDKLDRFINTVNNNTKGIPGFEPINRNVARQSFEFKQMYKDYKNTKDRTRGGARHLALIYFGILDEDDDYY